MRKLLIIAARCCAAAAQMQRFDSQATATTGQPGSIQLQAVLPGSTVYVCTGSTAPCNSPGTASLFSDIAGTVSLAQPVTADANGRFGWYWAAGTYVITITPPVGSIGTVQSYVVTAGATTAPEFSFTTPTPYAPSPVTATVVGTPGSTTYYYWVVSNFTIGNSAPSAATVVNTAAATLSQYNYDQISWAAVTGANTYDVLRTTSATAPTGACACAVATAVSGLTTNDQSNSLSAYTVSTYAGDTTFHVTNVAVAAGESKLTFAADHGAQFSVDSINGVGAPIIEAVRYADQYPGADMGAKVIACLSALPAAGGICDATALTGTQSATSTITVGSVTQPETLLLGPVTLTSLANPAIVQAGQSSIYGVGGGGDAADPAAATLIKATASGATTVSWTGSSGILANVGLESASGDALDLAASGSTSILGNQFVNDSAKCDQHTANQAVLLSADNSAALVSFNQFLNLRTYDCLYGVRLATTGNQGPTDNQFIGGQITKSTLSGDGFDFSGAGTGATNIYGMNIAGNAIGARLETGTASNKFDGVTFESNTKDTQVDSGSADNQFLYGGGDDGNTDAGLRTTYLGGEWAGGPNGSSLSTLPGAFDSLALNSPSGEPTTLNGTATTLGVALALPPLSGTVAASGNCLGCNWTPGSKQDLASIIEIAAPNTNTGYALTLDADSAGRALFLASQGYAGGSTGEGISFFVTPTTATIQCGKNGFAAFDVCNFTASGISIGDGAALTTSNQTGTGNIVLASSLPGAGSVTTTAAGSDTVTITWPDGGSRTPGHCALSATNASAAANIATTYISDKASNAVTLAHAATASMTYDVVCTVN